MPTSWTIAETPATTLAMKSGIGNTWPGDWRVLQGYTWLELQQFTWAQLSGQSGWAALGGFGPSWGGRPWLYYTPYGYTWAQAAALLGGLTWAQFNAGWTTAGSAATSWGITETS